ncbi:MAG: type VI secretion system tip protein VgrG [Bacteroidota bacterium]
MAKHPSIQEIDLVQVDILVDGSPIDDTYAVTKVVIKQEVNKISSAVFEVLDGNPADQDFAISASGDFLPGKEVTIKVGYQTNSDDLFKGIILSHRIKSSGGEHSCLIVKCFDKALKMTTTRKSAYYVNSKDGDVLSQLIGNHGVDADVGTTNHQHKEIIQYQVTDWDFLMARAQINGMIALAMDGKVTVKAPEVTGAPKVELLYGVDIHELDLDMNAQHQLKQVECKAWDPGTHKIVSGASAEPSNAAVGNVNGKKLSDVLGGDDFIIQSSGQIDEGMLKAWASGRLVSSRLSRITGTVSCQGHKDLVPNTTITLQGLGDRFNGDAYVSGVKHEVQDGNWLTVVKIGLDANWFTEKQQDIMLPPASGSLPGIEGMHIGIVKQIQDDPDGEFRVQVDIPTIEESGEGVWARMVQLYASNEYGTFFWPEVGDEVLLSFLNGDPRFPVIVGKMYSKKNPAPYTPDEPNTIKAIVTKSLMKLEFEDEKKIITLDTPGGNMLIIDDDAQSITLEDQHGNKIVMESAGITLDSPKDINIKSKANINLEATQNITIKATGDATVEGMNVTNKASIAFKAEGSATAELKASGQTTVKGAIVMIN